MAQGYASESQRPANFIQSQSDFISAVDATGIASVVSLKGGKVQGTFAVELVAMKYAGWISPAYEVQVYQIAQAYKKGELTDAIPKTYAAALLEAGRLAMELEQAEATLAIAAPKAEVFDKVMERHNLLNATQVAQQVGMSAIKMNRHLDLLGGVYNKGIKRGRTFCQPWVDAGHGEMKLTEVGYPQALFTPQGSLRVVEMFISEGVV